MSSITVNDVIRVRQTCRDTESGAMFVSLFNYRCHSGELPHDKTWADAFEAAFKALITDRWMAQMSENTCLSQIDFRKIYPTPDTTWEYPRALGAVPGSLVEAIGEDLEWRAAAVIKMRSYNVGRKALGRKYFGPLLERFFTDGRLTINPTGDGDLTDLIAKCGDPLSVTVGPLTQVFRPIVCASVPVAIDSKSDVKAVGAAQYVSYLRTRKPGIGG